jgi:Protein of unknown function (DUF2897)
MFTAIVVIVIVLGLLVGIILGLRSSAKIGMPPEDVLKRITQHARELEAQKKGTPEQRGD